MLRATTRFSFTILLIFAGLLGQGVIRAAATDFKAGDRIEVTAEQTLLKAGRKTLATVSRGQQGVVEQTSGQWVLTTITVDGQAYRGWLSAKAVARVEPKPRPTPAPQPREPQPRKAPPAMRTPAKQAPVTRNPAKRTPVKQAPAKQIPAARTPVTRTPIAADPVFAETATLQGHADDVFCLAFSADGKTLVSGGGDRAVIVWDVGKREQLTTLVGHEQRVRCLAFSPVMDNVLASGGGQVNGGELKLWNLKDQKLLADLPAGRGEIVSLDFGPDGVELFTAGWTQFVAVWDVITTRPKGSARAAFGEIVRHFAVSPQDDLIAVSGKEGLVYLYDLTAFREDGSLLATAVKQLLAEHRKPVTALAFSRDGRYLATAGDDEMAIVWNVETGEVVRKIDVGNGLFHTVALSPDGSTLVTSNMSLDSPLKVWDVATGRMLRELPTGTTYAVAFSPSGRLMAYSDGLDVRLWSVRLPSKR